MNKHSTFRTLAFYITEHGVDFHRGPFQRMSQFSLSSITPAWCTMNDKPLLEATETRAEHFDIRRLIIIKLV